MQLTRSRVSQTSQLGLTLIEIMIVLAVIGLLVGSIGFSFGAGRQAEISRSTNQIANTIRFAFDKARVGGEFYRLLIDLEQNSVSLQKADERMFLPATDRNGEQIVIDTDKLKDQEARDLRAEEDYNHSIQSKLLETGKDKETDQMNPYAVGPRKVPRRKPPIFNAFADENTLSTLKKPILLPKEVEIASVQTADDIKPITQGQASLYFFPQGRTQAAHIQLKKTDGEYAFTIIVHPLTGRVEIKEGLVDLVLPKRASEQEDDLGNRSEKRMF